MPEYKMNDGRIFNGVTEEDAKKIKEISDSELIIVKINELKKSIKNYIYLHYSAEKQSQDQVWVMAFRSKLVAGDFKDIEKTILSKASSVINGQTISKVVSSYSKINKPMVEKLIKVAIKTNWAELCVIEGKAAIEEDRDFNFPKFPQIEG